MRLSSTTLFLALLAPLSWAEDRIVQPGESIQAAIAASFDGDRVLVRPGTYLQTIDFAGKAITVLATGGPTRTTIDATGLGGPVVRFHAAEGPGSLLRGFSITGGRNLAPFRQGGGISGQDFLNELTSTARIEDCRIYGNAGLIGGGAAGNFTIRRTSIYDNEALTGDGGGLWGGSSLEHCVVADNRAVEGEGGGIFVREAAAAFAHCVIVANRSNAVGRGGGIYVDGSATLDLFRSLVVENEACSDLHASNGGGIYVAGGLSLRFSTVAANRTSGLAPGTGGIHGFVNASNSIIWENTNAELFNALSVSWCDVSEPTPGIGNFNDDPLFTAPAAGDYHPVSTSPTTDAGDPSLTDSDDGSRADIGAYLARPLGVRENTTPAEWMTPAFPEIPVRFGGEQRWSVRTDAGLAGLAWALLGSITGTSPGTSVLGVQIPLNPDGYFRYSTLHLNTLPLASSLGTLDGLGVGQARFLVPGALPPVLAGLTLWHAAIIFDPDTSTGIVVSNPVELLLVP